jgi:hypothetical protein
MTVKQQEEVRRTIELFKNEGLMGEVADRVVLTDAGFVVQNEIAVKLCR